MKMKTSELEGAALDWAVAAVTGEYDDGDHASMEIDLGRYSPSTDWSRGGPLIDAYDLEVCSFRGTTRARWMQATRVGMAPGIAWQYGPTALIASMRAIVASELGDEVDIPDELLEA